MPKSTFFNLADEKRNRIIEAAVEEFARYSYEGASINRIVERAGIAKGSFYQYFEDKKDLYKYIIDLSGEKKLQYITHIMEHLEHLDFFQVFREIYIGGILFAKENPRLAAIGYDFVKNADSRLKEEIMGNAIQKSNRFMKGLLERGIRRGEIDPKIDVDLVAFMLTSLSVSIGEYFLKEYKGEEEMEIMVLIDKMLQVIEKGIRNKKEGI